MTAVRSEAGAPDASVPGIGTALAAPDWMRLAIAALLVVNLAFLTIHLGSFVLFGRVLEFLYLDAESNIPTWWSSAQLLVAGLLLGLVVVRNSVVRPGASLVLGLLALLLVVMSLDEVSGLHEQAGLYLDLILGDRRGTRFHHSGLWFAVVGLPFAIVVLLMLRWLSAFLGEVPGTRSRLLLGFAVLLAGAVGFEALANFVIPEALDRQRAMDGRYVVVVGMEEFLEMCGGSLLLWANLGLVRNHWSTRGVVAHLRPLTADGAAALRPGARLIRTSG